MSDEGGVPAWKRKLLAGQKAKVQAKREQEATEAQLQEERLEGVPEWKRKLMAKKAVEIEAKMKPIREKEQQKKELEEKLLEMPPWKRELFLKKNSME